MSLSVTESANRLTSGVDRASPADIWQLLGRVDRQMFTGWDELPHEPTLMSEAVTHVLAEAIEAVRAAAVAGHGKALLVMSGAGTSGRLAWVTARAANRVFGFKFAHYLMASGDKALLIGQERGEDDPRAGVADLEIALHEGLPEGGRLVFIGITCGLSAPYVGAQLEHLLLSGHLSSKIHCSAFLLGFNPARLARDAPVEHWGSNTFRTVLHRLLPLRQPGRSFALLNPVVGPEAITGSTRMKGGSATKILLDAIISTAAMPSGASPVVHLQLARQSVEELYGATPEAGRVAAEVARAIAAAGSALQSGGRVRYAAAVASSLALFGIIDASECPPTYGASTEDVRGFVAGGWAELDTNEGDLSGLGHSYRISLEDLEAHAPLGKEDCAFLLVDSSEPVPDTSIATMQKLAAVWSAAEVRWGVISVGALPWAASPCGPIAIHISVSQPVPTEAAAAVSVRGLRELRLKLVLNAITTGAHILRGKVWSNRMIDLRPSNDKLLYRSVGIVARVAGVDEKHARHCLLTAIHGQPLPAPVEAMPASAHISAAMQAERVVPKAILIASGRFTLEEAAAALKREPIIARLLSERSS